MEYIRAIPRSVLFIRECANELRSFLRLDDHARINAPKLLDVLSVLWEKYGFQYMVMPDDNSMFGFGEEAKTDISTGMIYIKESVMNQACHHKYKRASFTICHEIGHFVLHRMLGGVSFARSTCSKKPQVFADPEWQANTFASEFLMPATAVRDMSPDEIRETFCVSSGCAWVRYQKMGGERIQNNIENYLKN